MPAPADNRKQTFFVLIAAAAVGAAVFGLSLGFRIVQPTFIDWLIFGDWRIHFLGWHTYRTAPWHWPLGANSLFGYPVGTSVALTDSLPVVAIPLKTVSALLPVRFQYIGLWMLLCFTLQGVFGALLARLITPRRALQVLCGALFVGAPILIHRVEHPALAAHWTVLAALWLHFRDAPRRPTRFSLLGWGIVVAIAAATHAYLAFMILAILGADVAGRALVSGRDAWRPVIALAALAVVFALVFWQAGYLIVRSAEDLRAAGFGELSTGLLGPVAPLEERALIGSRVLPKVPQVPEGYTYLGAGILALVVPAAVGLLRSLRGITREFVLRQLPLVAALCLLWAMSLGPAVRIGEFTLLDYSADWWGPLTTFRANGRMFWPVFYVIVLAVLFGVTRFSAPVASTMIVVSVVLQAVDLGPAYAAARIYEGRRWTNPLSSRFWDVVPSAYQRILPAPSAMCSVAGEAVDFEPFALIAGDHGMALSAGFAARYDVQRVADFCRQVGAELERGVLDDQTLLVFRTDHVPRFPQYVSGPMVCVDVDRYHACGTIASYARWQHLFDAASHVLPSSSELAAFHGSLSEEYVRMGRSATGVVGSTEERIRALREYMVYRVTSCGHAGAMQKFERVSSGRTEPRVCGNPVAPLAPLPSPEEMFAFRRQLDETLGAKGRSQAETFVDPEGEAVWTLEYVAQRLAGRSPNAASDAVIARIRALARS